MEAGVPGGLGRVVAWSVEASKVDGCYFEEGVWGPGWGVYQGTRGGSGGGSWYGCDVHDFSGGDVEDWNVMDFLQLRCECELIVDIAFSVLDYEEYACGQLLIGLRHAICRMRSSETAR